MPISTRAEWKREQDREDVRQQTSLDIRAAESKNIEDRAQQRRMMRRLQIERQEVAMEDSLKKVQEYRILHAQQLEQDARFAEAVVRAKNEKLAEEKRRQQIRESSDELKQLEAKLRTAYALKELAMQVAEKKQMAIQEQKIQHFQDEVERELGEKQKKIDEEEEREAVLRKKQYGSDLREQAISDNEKKRELFEEFLKEKQVIDAVVRRMHEEDEKAELERMEKVEKTKREIEDFKKAQEIWKQRHRELLEEENRRIQEYLEKQKSDEEQLKLKNKERENFKNMLSEQVAARIYAAEKKKRDKLEVMQMMAEEELLAAHERRYQRDLEKKLRDRAERQEVYLKQCAEKKERLQREASQDQAYRQQLLDKMAEDARVDQLTREKQRTKMIQLRHEVEEVLQAKRIQRAEEMQQVCKLEEMAKEEEKKRRDLIEDERLRMLKEHAKNVFGYIPIGVLRESDLPILGPEFVEKYGSKGAVPKRKTDA